MNGFIFFCKSNRLQMLVSNFRPLKVISIKKPGCSCSERPIIAVDWASKPNYLSIYVLWTGRSSHRSPSVSTPPPPPPKPPPLQLPSSFSLSFAGRGAGNSWCLHPPVCNPRASRLLLDSSFILFCSLVILPCRVSPSIFSFWLIILPTGLSAFKKEINKYTFQKFRELCFSQEIVWP